MLEVEKHFVGLVISVVAQTQLLADHAAAETGVGSSVRLATVLS